MIIPFLEYIAKMQAKGERITQAHINRLLDTMEMSGKDVSKNRSGGVCKCGSPYVLKKIDNRIGKFQWYIRSCDCED